MNDLAFINRLIFYHVSRVFGPPLPNVSHNVLILLNTVSLFMRFFSTAALANGEALLYFCPHTEVTPSGQFLQGLELSLNIG